MFKRVWVAIVASLALTIGVNMLLNLGRSTENTGPVTLPTDVSLAPQSGQLSYVSYTDAVIANYPGKKVLFFHAPWCPQCRMIEADILKGPLPEGWTIIKVDYDSHQDLRKKYRVTLQTTFVKVDDQGTATDKFVAYQEPTLANITKNYLEK